MNKAILSICSLPLIYISLQTRQCVHINKPFCAWNETYFIILFFFTRSKHQIERKKKCCRFLQSVALSHAHREQRNALKLNLSYPQPATTKKAHLIHMTTEKQYDRRKPQAVNKKEYEERAMKERKKKRISGKKKRVCEASKNRRKKNTIHTEREEPFYNEAAKPAATSSNADRNWRKFADFIWGSIRLLVWLYVLLYICMQQRREWCGECVCIYVCAYMQTSSKIGIICFAIRWSI